MAAEQLRGRAEPVAVETGAVGDADRTVSHGAAP
jgi:hypothetical protein